MGITTTENTIKKRNVGIDFLKNLISIIFIYTTKIRLKNTLEKQRKTSCL
jgi:hypothetical protein